MPGTHAKVNKPEKVEVKSNKLEDAIVKLLSKDYTIKMNEGGYKLFHSKFNQQSIVDRYICIENADCLSVYVRDLQNHEKHECDS